MDRTQHKLKNFLRMKKMSTRLFKRTHFIVYRVAWPTLYSLSAVQAYFCFTS